MALSRGAEGADGQVFFGAFEGAPGDAGGLGAGTDLAGGEGAGGEGLAQEVEGRVESGGTRRRCRGRPEVETFVRDAEAERLGRGSQVIFDDGEAPVVGSRGIGGVEGPDDAGGLDDGAGAKEVILGKTGAGAGAALAQMVGEEEGFGGDTGDFGENEHDLGDGGWVAADAEAAEAIDDNETDTFLLGEGEQGPGVAGVARVEVVHGVF